MWTTSSVSASCTAVVAPSLAIRTSPSGLTATTPFGLIGGSAGVVVRADEGGTPCQGGQQASPRLARVLQADTFHSQKQRLLHSVGVPGERGRQPRVGGHGGHLCSLGLADRQKCSEQRGHQQHRDCCDQPVQPPYGAMLSPCRGVGVTPGGGEEVAFGRR